MDGVGLTAVVRASGVFVAPHQAGLLVAAGAHTPVLRVHLFSSASGSGSDSGSGSSGAAGGKEGPGSDAAAPASGSDSAAGADARVPSSSDGWTPDSDQANGTNGGKGGGKGGEQQAASQGGGAAGGASAGPEPQGDGDGDGDGDEEEAAESLSDVLACMSPPFDMSYGSLARVGCQEDRAQAMERAHVTRASKVWSLFLYYVMLGSVDPAFRLPHFLAAAAEVRPW